MIRKKNILFINTFIPPGFPIIKDVYDLFNKEKYNVQFLISRGDYYSHSTKGDFKSIWAPKLFRKSKLICHLTFYLIAPFYILRIKSELNVFLTQPPFFFFWGCVFKKIKNEDYIIHVMDVYPDVLNKSKILKTSGLITKFMLWLSHISHYHSKNTIVIGRCMKELFINNGVPPEKLSVITNWSPIKEREFINANEINEKSKFTILYSGNMGIAHEFQTILVVIKELVCYAIAFLFVGQGKRKIEIQSFAKKNNLDNITILDHQPDAQLLRILKSVDIHFISLKEQFKGTMVPSNYYTALVTKKPIIFEGPKDSEISLDLIEYNCGLVVPNNSCILLKTAILNYFKDKDFYDSHCKNAYNLYLNKYKPHESAKRYVDHIEGLVNS